MSEVHKFLFDGLPVRGAFVRLDSAWQEVLRRRAANTKTGTYPAPVRQLLGEMLAAGVLMQSAIQFNGALVLQIFGDGALKLAVAEVQSNFNLRATAKVQDGMSESIKQDATLAELVNAGGQGRCAITLDPQERSAGQRPYQGVVSLSNAESGQSLPDLSSVLGQYMHQSEQLETVFILAADDQTAAGLLIQRMPLEGHGEGDEDYQRIATLASSLRRDELLGLDAETILHRLFWQEKLLRFVPEDGDGGPRFACTCSRERVEAMLRNLGQEEVDSVIEEQGKVEVSCDYCGTQYQFDPIDVAQLFTDATEGRHSAPGAVQ